MVKRLLRRALPPSVYGLGRRWADSRRRARRKKRSPISEEEFRRILGEELGIAEGGVVFVHSSLEEIELGFPFFRILPILREVVGDGGTLLFPATHLRERPESWLARDELFDVNASPTTMGILPELVRRQGDAVRSAHPTHSVVGVGPLAQALIERHAESIYPCGEESPYYRIVEHGGIIVGIGVDVDVLTFVHCVEDRLRERFPVETRPDERYVGRVRDAEGREREVETLVAHPRIWWRDIPRYMRRYVSADICRRCEVNGARFYRVDASRLYAHMEGLALKGKTIYPRGIYRDHPLNGPMTWLARRAG